MRKTNYAALSHFCVISLMLVLGLILSFFSGCASNSQLKDEEVPTWQEQYDLGVRYLSKGNYQEAIIAFTAAIEIDPKRADAYEKLADAYLALDDLDSALQALQDGYDAAGDARLQARIDELTKPDSMPTPTPNPTLEPTPEPTSEPTLEPTPEVMPTATPSVGALVAYRAYLEQSAGLPISPDYFYLVELDGDDEPELLIASRPSDLWGSITWTEIESFLLCDYQEGQVAPIHYGKVDNIDCFLEFIPDNAALRFTTGHGTGFYAFCNLYFLNGNLQIDEYRMEVSMESHGMEYYSLNGQPITKETYFAGQRGPTVAIDFWDNTAANRDAFLK